LQNPRAKSGLMKEFEGSIDLYTLEHRKDSHQITKANIAKNLKWTEWGDEPNSFVKPLFNLENEYLLLERAGIAKSYTHNILVIGDTKSGKTTFIKRWVDDVFCEKYVPTVGICNYEKKFLFAKNSRFCNYTFNIQEIGGKEKLTTSNTKDIEYCILCISLEKLFDADSYADTINNAREWLKTIDNFCLNCNQSIPVAVICTMQDMYEPNNQDRVRRIFMSNSMNFLFDNLKKLGKQELFEISAILYRSQESAYDRLENHLACCYFEIYNYYNKVTPKIQ
jgi:GTPase SAR1 family protein